MAVYQTRRQYVEAIQRDKVTVNDILDFAGDKATVILSGDNITVRINADGKDVTVMAGDYIVKKNNMFFKVMSSDEFHKLYEIVEE